MILITGATGFIGRQLVRNLLDSGYETALVVNNTPPEDEWMERAIILKADITKAEEMCRLKKYRFDKIIHMAAYIPRRDCHDELEKCIDVNIKGIGNLLELARLGETKRFINSSSIMVYGDAGSVGGFKEKRGVFPDTYYGMSKLMSEMLCEKYRKMHGLETVSLRYSYVYGPGMAEQYVFEKFVRLARHGEEIPIYGTGKGIRDFIYVKDVIAAIKLAMNSAATGSFNIGTGKGHSLADLASNIIDAAKSKSKYVFHRDREGDQSFRVLDITESKRHLGFNPRYTLADGLKDYLGDAAS